MVAMLGLHVKMNLLPSIHTIQFLFIFISQYQTQFLAVYSRYADVPETELSFLCSVVQSSPTPQHTANIAFL